MEKMRVTDAADRGTSAAVDYACENQALRHFWGTDELIRVSPRRLFVRRYVINVFFES